MPRCPFGRGVFGFLFAGKNRSKNNPIAFADEQICVALCVALVVRASCGSRGGIFLPGARDLSAAFGSWHDDYVP